MAVTVVPDVEEEEGVETGVESGAEPLGAGEAEPEVEETSAEEPKPPRLLQEPLPGDWTEISGEFGGDPSDGWLPPDRGELHEGDGTSVARDRPGIRSPRRRRARRMGELQADHPSASRSPNLRSEIREVKFEALDLDRDGFGDWLAGFIDGEGCFQILENRSSGGWFRYRLWFRISLRDDDAEILYEIQRRTGLGSITRRGARRSEWGATVDWIVRQREEIRDLCEILDRYPLRAKKSRDFEIWKRAADLWIGGIRKGGLERRAEWEAANREVWKELRDLREALISGRKYRRAAA
jgi:hypothetical protein